MRSFQRSDKFLIRADILTLEVRGQKWLQGVRMSEQQRQLESNVARAKDSIRVWEDIPEILTDPIDYAKYDFRARFWASFLYSIKASSD